MGLASSDSGSHKVRTEGTRIHETPKPGIFRLKPWEIVVGSGNEAFETNTHEICEDL